MKPGAEEEANFMPERTLGNKPKVVRDEEVNGEYGLVINGHSLVRHIKTQYCFSWYLLGHLCTVLFLPVFIHKIGNFI